MVAWERGSSRVSSDQDHHGEWSAGGWQSHSIWMGRNEEQGGEIHLLHCGPSSLGLPPPERPFELFLCLYTFPTASLTLVLHITGTVHHLVLPLSLCILPAQFTTLPIASLTLVLHITSTVYLSLPTGSLTLVLHITTPSLSVDKGMRVNNNFVGL